MTRISFWLGSTMALVAAWAATAQATDISAKKLFIKNNAQVQVLSVDHAIRFADAVDPATNGAILHLYSATDDLCLVLAGGRGWVNKKGKFWKFKDKGTKSSAQLKNGRLLIAVKSGVTFGLADNGSQGTVDAQAQFGSGTRFCMRCTGAKKDDAKKFLGKSCAAAPCDPEPSSCGSAARTTTTTLAGTTPTTSPSGGGLKGALTPTPGRFNYNLAIGLAGADAACDSHFAGTHACTYPELQSAQAAGSLAGLTDFNGTTVTAFWAIDASQPPLQQCNDDAAGGSGLNWEYATAHTASRGQKVALDNAAGTLGALQSSLQCNFSTAWVGCCQ